MENKREWIEFLLKKSKFQLTEEEISKFEKDLDIFTEQLKELDKFNLDDVRPISVPFDEIRNVLRDDSEVINKPEKIIDNASNSKDGYIFLKKGDK